MRNDKQRNEELESKEYKEFGISSEDATLRGPFRIDHSPFTFHDHH
jgi:hypothetical protein